MGHPDEDLINYLSGFITRRRSLLMDRILEQRTRYMTIALEDIFQPHNASAVLRTCECFGIQDIHIIENKNKYTLNPDVALGASKWLNLIKYNSQLDNTCGAVNYLRSQNYRIVATSLHKKAVSLESFDLTPGKTAIFFGTELTGLTKTMMDQADEYLRIPISGFTESFNISVSAAIILHHLILQLKKSDINWKLAPEEKLELKLQWLRNSIKHADKFEKEWLRLKK